MFARAKRLFRRVRPYSKPLPEPELLCAEARPMTRFFTSLTAEQQKRALSYRGEENHGDPKYSLKAMPLS